MVNKEQAIIDFLRECPAIATNPLFFNFINAKPDNKQLITVGNDKNMNRPYINGSILKRYTFTVIDFKSITYQAIVGLSGHDNENVEEYMDIQAIINWVDEQSDARNYPNFGDECDIESMTVLTDNPVLNGTDTQVKPALAKYSFSIQIEYIDNSKALF